MTQGAGRPRRAVLALVPGRRDLRAPRAGVSGQQRGRRGRPRGARAAPRSHPGPRRDRRVAPAVLSLAAPGRRLRHLRVQGDPSRVRDDARLPHAAEGGAPARPEGDHRGGDEPHLGRAPVVPARPHGQAEHLATQLLRVGGHARGLRRRPGDLRRLRVVELGVGSDGRPVLLAPLLLPPAGPELRRAAGPGGDVRRRGLLARARGGRAAAGRRALPVRARGHELREPAGDPRVPLRPAPAHRCDVRGSDAPRGSEPVARGRRRLLRQGRPMPDGVPLPADAADVHGEPDGGPVPADRHPEPDAADPRERPVGDVPPQPRRAHARDGHRRGARLHVPRLRRRPAGPDQPRDPAAPRSAARQRPAPDRADERAAVLAARDAGHLLRRRDRHGRQHLPR